MRPSPVIILGGAANALSVARSLGRAGADVFALVAAGEFVRRSRFCQPIDVPGGVAGWTDFLLGPDSDRWTGAVLLSCSDDGIELIAEHREALARRFLLDDSHPPAQRAMLNKLDTYRAAEAAGVPTPRFWVAGLDGGLDDIAAEAEFPLIVKPCLSHVFESQTGRKLFVVNDRGALSRAVATVASTGTESLVVEMIPGLDSQLCSYFTYLDDQSQPLFHFTKRIVRRYPTLRGTACYHVTDHIPEAVELGNRLFRAVGLRGLANVEFKLDARDGRLKLIECNARFTASNALVARSGIDLALFVYNRLTGRPPPPTDHFRSGVRMWDPIRDFQAYRELSRAGKLSFVGWVQSICRRQMFPFFEWSDPMPALARLTKPLRNRLGLLADVGG